MGRKTAGAVGVCRGAVRRIRGRTYGAPPHPVRTYGGERVCVARGAGQRTRRQTAAGAGRSVHDGSGRAGGRGAGPRAAVIRAAARRGSRPVLPGRGAGAAARPCAVARRCAVARPARSGARGPGPRGPFAGPSRERAGSGLVRVRARRTATPPSRCGSGRPARDTGVEGCRCGKRPYAGGVRPVSAGTRRAAGPGGRGAEVRPGGLARSGWTGVARCRAGGCGRRRLSPTGRWPVRATGPCALSGVRGRGARGPPGSRCRHSRESGGRPVPKGGRQRVRGRASRWPGPLTPGQRPGARTGSALSPSRGPPGRPVRLAAAPVTLSGVLMPSASRVGRTARQPGRAHLIIHLRIASRSDGARRGGGAGWVRPVGRGRPAARRRGGRRSVPCPGPRGSPRRATGRRRRSARW